MQVLVLTNNLHAVSTAVYAVFGTHNRFNLTRVC